MLNMTEQEARDVQELTKALTHVVIEYLKKNSIQSDDHVGHYEMKFLVGAAIALESTKQGLYDSSSPTPIEDLNDLLSEN